MAVLFTVETPRTRLAWSGPEAAVRDPRETLRVTGETDVGEAERPLRLEEEATYTVWLESLDGRSVRLLHADPVVIAALASARGGTIVHGPVRFGSQAGRSRFVVTSGGVPEASVDVTVAPTKASWADVEVMRMRTEAAAAGLSLAALRPAGVDASATPGRASAPVLIALLREAMPRLAEALEAVARDPETVVVRALVSVRPHVLRRASSETVRALRGAAVWPERVPGRPARQSLDTSTHRWLAAGVDAVLARLRGLGTPEKSARHVAIRNELDRNVQTLVRLRRLEPLAAAGRPAPATPPLVIRPAYVRAVGALATLLGALRLADGDVRASAQDLSALYETWAALVAVEAFASAVGADAPARPFGARAVGTDVRLGRGARRAVRLVGERGEARIVRQPRFSGPPALLVQIPDLLVTLRVPGRPERRVVLDAKYRLDARRGAPPGDALGALHRYRDAIVGPDGQPLVETAAVLFPLRAGDGFEASRLWTSLGTLGVGAVPLLPGATGWIEALARSLVGEI